MLGKSSARNGARRGFSLLELVAVVTLLGIIAAVTMVRLNSSDKDNIKKTACEVNKGEINLQTRLWRRSKGTWPANDLSDIRADARFFPKGVPTCPVDGSAYTLNGTTHEVTGHTH